MGSNNIPGQMGRKDVFMYDPDAVTLVTNPGDPLYDVTVHDNIKQEDVENVIALGILEPVGAVKRKGASGDIETCIKYGRKRTKWAREANRQLAAAGKTERVLLPVTFGASDPAILQMQIISENERRHENSIYVKAQKTQHALSYGATPEQLSVSFGVTQVTLKNWLKLLDLSPALQAAVKAEKIAPSLAWSWHGLTFEEQDANLEKFLAANQDDSGAENGGEGDGETATKRRKARSGAARDVRAPNKRKIRDIVARLEDGPVKTALRWALGEVSDEEAAKIEGWPKEAEEQDDQDNDTGEAENGASEDPGAGTIGQDASDESGGDPGAEGVPPSEGPAPGAGVYI